MTTSIGDQSIKNYLGAFPGEEQLAKAFHSAFVLIKPVSGVGGDGYWLQKTGSTVYLVVFDCVGHGRLASIMTRIYIEAIKEVFSENPAPLPADALVAIHEKLRSQFAERHRTVGSGADIAIVRVETARRKTMCFAGAKMDLVQVGSGGVVRHKGDKRQVGDMFDYSRQYSNIEVALPPKETTGFYLYTDGITDLMGGPAGKKLKFSNLENILKEVAGKPADQQKKLIEKKLTAWSGPHLPFDDMLMIGFEV